MEIYVLSPDERSIDEEEYKLLSMVREENQEKLKLYMSPGIQISFEQLFDGID